jgi:Domain of unknown function (DUF892)
VTFFSAHIDNLRKLYVNQVQMLLSNRTPDHRRSAKDGGEGDRQITSLKEAFQTHLEETKDHAIRREEVLVKETGGTETVKCRVLAALVDEAEDMMIDPTDESVRDVALIAAAERVERYKIATYGAVGTVRENSRRRAFGRTSEPDDQDRTIKTGRSRPDDQGTRAGRSPCDRDRWPSEPPGKQCTLGTKKMKAGNRNPQNGLGEQKSLPRPNRSEGLPS